MNMTIEEARAKLAATGGGWEIRYKSKTPMSDEKLAFMYASARESWKRDGLDVLGPPELTLTKDLPCERDGEPMFLTKLFAREAPTVPGEGE